VKRKDEHFGISSHTTDPSGNWVFTSTACDCRDLVVEILSEFNTPIVVKPKKILDWNITVEIKGKGADEVLQQVATKCRLSLGKSSAGLPMLSLPGDASSDEAIVNLGGDDDGDDGMVE
jgi:hypothetical protein